MSRLKKSEEMQQIYQQNKIQNEDIYKYEQSQSYNIFQPLPIKTSNIQMFLQKKKEQKKKKRIVKNKKQKITFSNHQHQIIPSYFSSKIYHNKQDTHQQTLSNYKNLSNKKILTLQVNDDIKTYYSLLDLTQSLDALIIRYYKDPLLSTILMDSNIDVKNIHDDCEGQSIYKQPQSRKQRKQPISNMKSKENHGLHQKNVQHIKIKLQQNQQQQSQVYESDVQSNINEQFSQNQQNSSYSQSLAQFNVKGKAQTLPKYEQPSSLSMNKNIPKNQKDQNDKLKQQKQRQQVEQFSNNKIMRQNNGQQKIVNEKFNQREKQLKLSDLHNWLKQIAIFIDKFSSQEFKKLFQLKQLLNLILRSVNKSVKKQLDQFYIQLQNKQKNNQISFNQNKTEIFWENYNSIQIDQFKNNNQIQNNQDDHHVCRICWQYFVNGHQLGGHMSKKHPGHSLQYRNKQLIKTRKVIERQRRLYFRMIRGSAKQSKILKEQKKPKIEN